MDRGADAGVLQHLLLVQAFYSWGSTGESGASYSKVKMDVKHFMTLNQLKS